MKIRSDETFKVWEQIFFEFLDLKVGPRFNF